jgi:prevent-host-death family protein
MDEAAAAPSRRGNGKTTLAARPPTLDDVYIWMYIIFMPKSYSIAKARAKLADIVDEVEAGSEVELTRRGKKVAVVMSAARYARLRGERVAFMAAFDTFRASHDLAEAGIDPSWARGLRQKDVGRPVKM